MPTPRRSVAATGIGGTGSPERAVLHAPLAA
jgi:hypothetical protein